MLNQMADEKSSSSSSSSGGASGGTNKNKMRRALYQNTGSIASLSRQNYVDFVSGLNQNPTTSIIACGQMAWPVSLFLLKDHHMKVLQYAHWYAANAQALCSGSSTKIDMGKLPDAYTKDTVNTDLDQIIVNWIKENINVSSYASSSSSSLSDQRRGHFLPMLTLDSIHQALNTNGAKQMFDAIFVNLG